MAVDLATFRLRRTTGDSYRMIFGLGRTPQTVTGIEKLVQLVVKMLLTSPGSDKTSPEVGGGILRLFLQPMDAEDASEVEQGLVISIDLVQDKIYEIQESGALPSDERLRELRLDELTFDPEAQSWSFVVRLISEAGASFALDLSNLLEKLPS